MKQLAVSQELKEKLQKFFDTNTGRYDIEAVRESRRAEVRMENPSDRFADIFSGFGDDDQAFEHNILSAAVQLNEQMDFADSNVQNTDAIVEMIITNQFPEEDKYGEKTVYDRFRKLTPDNQRLLVSKLLAIYEHSRDTIRAYYSSVESGTRKADKQYFTERRVYERAESIVLYSLLHHLRVADDGDELASYDLNRAYKFVAEKDKSDHSFADYELPEEYLASIGL